MKSIGSFEAKTHLPRILKQVEAGETFVVTRNGKPVARIAPVERARVKDAQDVLRRLRALRLNLGSANEIRAMRDEGRRA